MQKLYQLKRLLCCAVFVLLAVQMVSCQGRDGTAQNIKMLDNVIVNGYVENTAAPSPQLKNEKDQAALSQMRMVLSNDDAELYMGNRYDIALYDKKSGAVYFSNRKCYETSADVAGNEDFSQVSITFYNSEDTATVMTSYPDCIDDGEKNQVEVTEEGDCVSVKYIFGSKADDRVICPAFSAESYQKIETLGEAKIEEGALTVMQMGRFKMGYDEITYDLLSPTDRSIYEKQYPKLKELGKIFALKPELTDFQREQIEETSIILGLDQAKINEELSKLGEINSQEKKNPYFEVVLQYQLDHNDLLVSMDYSKIVEQEGYRLTQIDILPDFGAIHQSSSGYLFMPDGSGSIIYGSQVGGAFNRQTLKFYGTDYGIDQYSSESLYPNTVFPIYGLYDGQKTLFGIAESGQAMGGITAVTASETSSYAKIIPHFQYRAQDTIDLQGIGDNSRKNVFSDPDKQIVARIRYHALYGDQATYSGMARYYREYLVQTGQMNAFRGSGNITEIGMLGAFSKKEMKFGLQLTSEKAATTFEDAAAITEKLRQSGVENINLHYLGAVNGGLDYKAPVKLAYEKALGGRQGFEEMIHRLNEWKVPVYTGVDFLSVFKNGNGLSKQKDLSTYISKNYAVLASYHPATLERDKERVAYQINPASLSALADRLIQAEQENNSKNLYLLNMGESLSANYREGGNVSRARSQFYTEDFLKKLTDSGYVLKIEGVNSYVLPYADSFTNVPVTSSENRVSGQEIPFVGMVLHGYKDYSGPVINQEGYVEKSVLKCLESGAGLQYLLMQESPIVFAQTPYKEYYSLTASNLVEEIAKQTARINEVYEQTKDATFDQHTKLANQVYKMTYSNGCTVIINYGNSEVKAEGLTIGPMDFGWKGR